jgi:TolA-binding protein
MYLINFYLKKYNCNNIRAMNLSESTTQMRVALDTAEAEIKSLEGGRKAASARARKSLQSIKGDAHTLRKAITNHTKGMPVKSRAKAEPVAAFSHRCSSISRGA